MASIYGILNLNDTDRVFLSTLGQRVVYDAIREYLRMYQEELNAVMGVFVEEQTENYKERYKLPGGGRMQKGGFAPQGVPANVKTTGDWDVAYPLESLQDALGGDRVSMAYMTVQDLNRHLATITIRHTNSVRFEVLKGLLNNTARAFTDPLWGTLTIQPVANGDAVLYPPVLGSESEQTENHFIETGYAAAAISDANNPLKLIADDLEEHFGTPTGGANILAFVNNVEVVKFKALTEFVDVTDFKVKVGDNTATLFGLPAGLPGRTVGRDQATGVWVQEWRWVPAGYQVGIHLDAPKPLKKRVDPSYTGLPRGLNLVARDEDYPMETSYYDDRLGFGVGNRLNAVIVEDGTGGTYTIPAGYS